MPPEGPAEDWDCAIPALAAVAPEKVRGRSALLSTLADALTERELSSAPALAGLCLGFMPATRLPAAAAGGGRPLPSSTEDVSLEVTAGG